MFVRCPQKRHAMFNISLIPFPREIGLKNPPPQVGGKYSIIYAPAFIIDLMPKICIKVYTT